MTERDFLADVQAALEYRRRDWGTQFPAVFQEKAGHVKKVQKAGITTYDAAYAILGDVWANVKLRYAVAEVLTLISHLAYRSWPRVFWIDRRKITPAVLIALQGKDENLRWAAMDLAGNLGLKRAVPLLIQYAPTNGLAVRALGSIGDPRGIPVLAEIARNQSLENHERIHAIIALNSLSCKTETHRIATILHNIMTDTTDQPEIRALAAENLAHVGIDETIPSYIHLLSDPNVELRFWAAFGLVTLGRTLDISAAMPVIDRTVAYDKGVLLRWWSVASEAIPALEDFWYWQLGGCEERDYCSGGPMLISPLLEYHDFREAGKVFDLEKGIYEFTPIPQSTTLSIDPATFAKQILERWPAAKINVRQPQPEALILDWWMEGKESSLMGGLHRNGYWVFLSGDEAATLEFAMWLRDLIPAEYPLRIYGWADPGIEINATLGEIGFSEAERRARESWNEQLGKLVTEVNQMMEKANDQS